MGEAAESTDLLVLSVHLGSLYELSLDLIDRVLGVSAAPSSVSDSACMHRLHHVGSLASRKLSPSLLP